MIEPPRDAAMRHGPDIHGAGNAMVAEIPQNRLGEPGTGLDGMPWRVLVYTDLRRSKPDPAYRRPQHEMELHLTGNMERNIWSIDGKKYSEATWRTPTYSSCMAVLSRRSGMCRAAYAISGQSPTRRRGHQLYLGCRVSRHNGSRSRSRPSLATKGKSLHGPRSITTSS